MAIKEIKIWILVFAVFVFCLGVSFADVLESKSLTRNYDPVVLAGSDLPDYYGFPVNNDDPTVSPNQIFVWAFDEGSGWRQVVFQIDEINNAHPYNPPPVCTDGTYLGFGPNYMEGDDSLWDSNDELVFMSGETGDRVSLDEWAPGADNATVRYEITVTDPLIPANKGWVYIYSHTTLPAWTLEDYVSWDEGTNTVNSWGYTVDYPDSHQSAIYFTELSVTGNLGGTNQNLVQRSQLSWSGGFFFKCEATEDSIRTDMTVTGAGCGDYSMPWHAKDGRVRVVRSIMWMPYCWAITDGIGMYPSTFIKYYSTFFYDTQNLKFRGGSGVCDWIRGKVNHSTATTMTFYDSNSETATIDGTSETLANKPLWNWYQVSSPYGSYIQVYSLTKESSDMWNVYTDNGGDRGNAGWYIDDPTENTSEPNPWHDYYFFMLPPDQVNEGANYSALVDNPVEITSASQVYVIPPQNFDGIISVADVNGVCENQGVEITWDNVLDWNDGCSSSCDNRHFEIFRDGVKIYDEYNLTLSSWIDLTGTDRVTYSYGVEACNQEAKCTALDSTLPGIDYVSTAPVLSSSQTSAVDVDPCTAGGVEISWTAVSDWRDSSEGTRQYDLYWEVDSYATPIALNITSPYTYAVGDGAEHTYRIRATNGCSLYSDYDVSSSVADQESSAPVLPAISLVSVTDIDSCSFSGVQISWNPISDWGDNGHGTQLYNLYWSVDGFSAPVVSGATSPVVVYPPDSTSIGYRVEAVNGCDDSVLYTDNSGSDGEVAPNFAGVQSATDTDGCALSPVTISWSAVLGDGPEGWNDNGTGSGTRLFRILRDGVEISGSPVGESTTSINDQPPATNTLYTYTVRAENLNGCYTWGGSSVSGADYSSFNPVLTAGTTVVTDECDRGESPAQGVRVEWDGVADWGDNNFNTSGRRYFLYYSGNSYSTPVAAYTDGTVSAVYDPVDNVPYSYRIIARNGCYDSTSYSVSATVFDKTSCSPSCTVVVDDDFDSSDSFAPICYDYNFWVKTAGVGYNGTTGWQADLQAGASNTDTYSCLTMSSNQSIIWTSDVKIRFWSSSALASDDAGVVEVWTDDYGLWRKVNTLLYPVLDAVVPISLNSGTGSCGTDIIIVDQPAFQGTVAGAFYEARLDSFITSSTTELNIRFRAANGNTNNTSSWVIDEVMIGYGIADGVYWWSLNGEPLQGVIKSATDEAIFRWEDDGLYQVDEFRIYRSENPADMRTDTTSVLIHQEPDTDALSYFWETVDGVLPSGTSYFYKIYGYKAPCGESNQNEN